MSDDHGAFYEALLFIAERPESIDFLAHMRHVARASGYGAEPVASRRLPGAGCRLRRAARSWRCLTRASQPALSALAAISRRRFTA